VSLSYEGLLSPTAMSRLARVEQFLFLGSKISMPIHCFLCISYNYLILSKKEMNMFLYSIHPQNGTSNGNRYRIVLNISNPEVSSIGKITGLQTKDVNSVLALKKFFELEIRLSFLI